MVTYHLAPEPAWVRAESAVSARLPRTWAQRLRDPRTRVSVLLFASIAASVCALSFAAVARLAFMALGH